MIMPPLGLVQKAIKGVLIFTGKNVTVDSHYEDNGRLAE
jgi:hypothetical protein